MRIKYIFQSFILILTFVSCDHTKRISWICKPSNEIKVDKTELIKINEILGGSNHEFEDYACGLNVTNVKGWWTYQKFGLALYTEYYNPDRQDGYKNNIVRSIKIFDTINLENKRSKEHDIYYNQKFTDISTLSLDSIFGKTDYIKNKGNNQYYIYPKRHMTFVFDRQTKAFLNLYIMN